MNGKPVNNSRIYRIRINLSQVTSDADDSSRQGEIKVCAARGSD